MDDIMQQASDILMDLSEELATITSNAQKSNLIKNHLDSISKLFVSHQLPDFRPGLEWVNVSEPLSLQKLKGKIVLLDFFTYCCINCMHILPDLKKLEHDFSVNDGLVVVGVHSAKFTNEKITENIEYAAQRYEITHPIVNDVACAMWNNLGICCWPTLYLLGPNSEPLLMLQGEGHYDTLKYFICEALSYYEKKGSISHLGLPEIKLCAKPIASRVLYYPGRVSVSPEGNVLAIADTANHRILIMNPSGEILHVIGGSASGLTNGSFDDAKFSSPQGLTIRNNFVYVADTENHAIREIDLTSKAVKTLVGSGIQGHDYTGGLDGAVQAISSPWDVCFVKDILFIAMAGTHQIWGYFFKDTALWKKNYKKDTCAAIVGSGREENRNNMYPMSCGLAQPSGLAYDNEGHVYIADSESSTVRCLALNSGAVSNLAGGAIDPKDLFSFGDKDGIGVDAKLQHPLDVTWSQYDNYIYVCDSYNHKIKKIDRASKECTTVLDSDSKLNEPGGIFAFDDRVFIADTNNHCIKVLNLTNNTVSLQEVKYRDNSSTGLHLAGTYDFSIYPSNEFELTLEMHLPSGAKLTEGAPSKWSLNLPKNQILSADEQFSLSPRWELVGNSDSKTIAIDITCRIFYCLNDKCIMKGLKIPVVVKFSHASPKNTKCHVNYTLPENI